MAPIEISIPSTTISDTPKPHTLYNITIRLPLRSLIVQKRYSDFVAFHDSLTAQIDAPPPATLPPKSWLSRTIGNPRLLEERRKGLEEYLRAINDSEDARWRNSSAWRTFLNLPAATQSQHSSANSMHAALTGPGGLSGDGSEVPPITDPTTWLDCHREVKTHLHDARLQLARRDQASTPQKQHECSAQAKSNLVKVGRMLVALDEGLKYIQGDTGIRSGWGIGTGGGASQLGSGELRRRKDLLASARKEKDGLENLLNAMATKSKLDSAVATMQDKERLIGRGPLGKPKPGRVLGKETEQTRELDNEGVMQLQKQIMQNQDQSAEELLKILSRQKQLGVAINEELQIQKELLNQVDEDTDRLVLFDCRPFA
jgi:regulator of vacuolar morphogenesis